eukprot:3434118-Alexandrium_andersonii.AAC.1
MLLEGTLLAHRGELGPQKGRMLHRCPLQRSGRCPENAWESQLRRWTWVWCTATMASQERLGRDGAHDA